jgi:hypothetical protein
LFFYDTLHDQSFGLFCFFRDQLSFLFHTYFFFVEIDVEIDKVCRSEDIDGTKHTSCLSSCSSMTDYMIRVSDYFTSSEINCHFCFIHTFFLLRSTLRLIRFVNQKTLMEPSIHPVQTLALLRQTTWSEFRIILFHQRSIVTSVSYILFFFGWDRRWDW